MAAVYKYERMRAILASLYLFIDSKQARRNRAKHRKEALLRYQAAYKDYEDEL